MPEDSPDEIAAKRRRFAAGRADPHLWAYQIAADFYTAAFLVPKTGGMQYGDDPNDSACPGGARWAYRLRPARRPGTGPRRRGPRFPLAARIPGRNGIRRLRRRAWQPALGANQAAGARILRCPRSGDCQCPNAAARRRLVAELKNAESSSRDRALYEAFETAKRAAEAASVSARVPSADCGRFPLTGRGDVNTYALFSELFSTLTGPRGRAGVVIQSNILTDETTKAFAAEIIGSGRVISFLDMVNLERIFLGIDTRNPHFALMTLASTGAHQRPVLSFYNTRPAHLDDEHRHFTLSAKDIALINRNTRTLPTFRSRADSELNAKIYERSEVIEHLSGGVTSRNFE